MVGTDVTYLAAKELKVGKYVVIDNTPCRVVSIDTSKPGKHGAAKMRIVGIGIFDGSKKNLLTSTSADVLSPIITRATAQIISVSGKTAQLMDSKTYEMFEIDIPEEMLANAEAGKEVELLEAMGKKVMTKIK